MAKAVELTGAPRKLAFPQACASCGTPAGRRIPVEKVFERGERHTVVRVDVPFCMTCLQRHREEAKHLPASQQLLTLVRSALLIPAIALALAAVVLFAPLADSVAAGAWDDALVYFGIVGGFGVLGIGLGVVALRRSHRFRVTEPTSVTSAFDFTDDLSRNSERERHGYTMRNPRFAEAFVAVNASKIRA